MIVGTQRWNTTSFALLGTVLVAIFLLYFPFLKTLVVDWDTNDNYSHGYFIPVITLYMIYSLRKDLARMPLHPSIIGLFLILCGLSLLIVAKIGSEFFLQRFSIIVVLLGMVHFLCGFAYLNKLALPILYLVFMIPLPAIIWNKIAFPMQLFGSYLTEQVIYLIGIPVFREGNVLHLAETTLEVVAACSGLRSLVTMFALSGALSFLSTLSPLKKWILFFAAAPIAIFANIVRLTATAILASIYGSDVAQGFLHDFSGIVIFVLGLSMLVGVNSLLARR
jgi:exosortase